jgi:hypothetical protein
VLTEKQQRILKVWKWTLRRFNEEWNKPRSDEQRTITRRYNALFQRAEVLRKAYRL